MPESLERILREQPFCRGMAEAGIALLNGCASNHKFASGEKLFRAGEAADSTWLIRAGRVAFELPFGAAGRIPLETAEDGELVGWAWLFPPYEYHFDAVAVGAVRALRLDGNCLRNKCEADPVFGYDFVKRVLFQAHQRLERSRLQAMDVYGVSR